MNKDDFISKISEFSKLCLSEIAANGEDESTHLTKEVASDMVSISLSNIDFIASSMLGQCLHAYISEFFASNEDSKAELISDYVVVVWSFIDSIADEDTRNLLLHSVKDQESFGNFVALILAGKNETETEPKTE